MKNIGNLPPDNLASDPVKTPGDRFFEEFPDTIEHTIELIKTQPNLLFAIYAPGRVLGTGGKTGTYAYIFGKEKQKMERTSMFDYLNQNNVIEGQEQQTEMFNIYINIYHSSIDHDIPTTTVSFKIPFGPMRGVENDFMSQPRGYDVTFALMFPSDPAAIDAFGEPGLKKCLQNPVSEEAERFFRALFFKCAHSWIPDYWKFFREQHKLQGKTGLPFAGTNIYERRIQEKNGMKIKVWKLLQHISGE